MASTFSGWGSSWGTSWGADTSYVSVAVAQDDNVVEVTVPMGATSDVSVVQDDNVVGVSCQGDTWGVFMRSAFRTNSIPSEIRTHFVGAEPRTAVA